MAFAPGDTFDPSDPNVRDGMLVTSDVARGIADADAAMTGMRESFMESLRQKRLEFVNRWSSYMRSLAHPIQPYVGNAETPPHVQQMVDLIRREIGPNASQDPAAILAIRNVLGDMRREDGVTPGQQIGNPSVGNVPDFNPMKFGVVHQPFLNLPLGR